MGPPVSPEAPVRVHALHPGVRQGRHPWPRSPTWEAHVHTAYPHRVTCVCGQVHGKGVCTRPPVGTPHPELRTARWTCPLQRHTGVCGDRREATCRGRAHLGKNPGGWGAEEKLQGTASQERGHRENRARPLPLHGSPRPRHADWLGHPRGWRPGQYIRRLQQTWARGHRRHPWTCPQRQSSG